MKLHFVSGTAAMALVAPAMADGFEFTGAEFSITGTYSGFEKPVGVDREWQTGSLGASFEFRLGDGGGLAQFDTAIQAYSPHFNDKYFVGAGFGTHIGYEFSSAATIGVFGSVDTWARRAWWDGTATVGLELAGEADRFFYDAYGAYNADLPHVVTDGHSYNLDAMGGYRIAEGVSFGVGGHFAEFDTGDTLWQAKAEARYDFTSDMSVAAGYTYTEETTFPGAAHSVTVSLTKKIGNGTTFKQRNLNNLFNGFTF